MSLAETLLKNIAKQIDSNSRKVLIMEIDRMSEYLVSKLAVFLILAMFYKDTGRKNQSSYNLISPIKVIMVKENLIAYTDIDIKTKAIEVLLTYPFQWLTRPYISSKIEAIQLDCLLARCGNSTSSSPTIPIVGAPSYLSRTALFLRGVLSDVFGFYP